MNIKARIQTQQYDTIKGLAPWFLLFASIFVFQWFYDTRATSFDWTVTGLKTRSIYLAERGSTACVGDMVEFSSPTQLTKFIRKVSAKAGDRFKLANSSYQVGESQGSINSAWQIAAQTQMGDDNETTVPSDHLLIINHDFGMPQPDNDWAYEIIPVSKIRKRMSYIIYTPEFSRIGQRISGNC